MSGIKTVSGPASFALRPDPQSVSPQVDAPLRARLPALRGQLVHQHAQPTALSARSITAGTPGTGGAAGASARLAAAGARHTGATARARPAQEIVPPPTPRGAHPFTAYRSGADAALLSAVLSSPGTPPSASLGILLRMADRMDSPDTPLLSVGAGALARRLASEPASQRQACIDTVAAAHQQGRLGEAAHAVLLKQLGDAH